MSTPMSTDFLLKGADVLLMLCVVRVASGSVVTADYGDVDAIPSILLWYGLAALYAVSACFIRDAPRYGSSLQRLAMGLSAAAGLCCVGVSIANPVTVSRAPMSRLEWAAMGLSFLCSAACHRLFTRR